MFRLSSLAFWKKGAKTRERSSNRNFVYSKMEQRRLLAGIVFDPAIGQVLIGGTNDADVAQVTQSGNSITVTQQGFGSETFDIAEVQSILFVGLRGDDFFQNQSSVDSSAFGQVGNDTLIGGSGNDRLVGNGNEDILIGNDGDDVLIAGIGDDQVDAGAGDDRVIGVGGTNRIEGGEGDDSIFGGNDDDTITDVAGDNLLVGSNGNDSITGSDGVDTIFGGPGEDTIFGAGGDDIIYAQAGNDFISGGAGVDVVGGNDGDDILQGEQGNDRLVGGNGNDRANFSGNLFSYDVAQSGPVNLILDDLRGPNFGLRDLVIGTEEYSFADGVRTADELRNNTQPQETVIVQPVIASNADGSNTAEFFGNDQQEQEIKNRIDLIFAQANIDVEFLPARTINNTFVNVGDGGNRPTSDLRRIVDGGDDTGVGSSDSRVVDLYFVETVPGFGNTSENVGNGLAFVGTSGIAVHVGDNLVNSDNGRAVVARVTAHEIAHNLGLLHVPGDVNLLAEEGTSTLLTPTQIDQALSSPISQPN